MIGEQGEFAMRYTLRMKPLILLGLLAVTAYGCAGFNGELPADFPADIPISSGEIYRASHARFEDGRGFVVSVLTTLSYEEVVAFYADVVGPRGNGYVLVETTNPRPSSAVDEQPAVILSPFRGSGDW